MTHTASEGNGGVLRSESATATGGIYFIMGVGSGIVAATAARSLWQVSLAVFGIVFFGVLGVRAARSSIRFDEGGVTARADRFTRRLAWDEIDSFGYGLRKGLGAYKKDGTWVRLQDYGLPGRKDAAAAVERLEDELRRHSGPGSRLPAGP